MSTTTNTNPLHSRYVHLVQPNGSVVATDILKGTRAEQQPLDGCYSVMVEKFADRYGKLYFSTIRKFHQRSRQGRAKNEASGRFPLARDYAASRRAAVEAAEMNGMVTEGGEDDVIIEEYTVEYEDDGEEGGE